MSNRRPLAHRLLSLFTTPEEINGAERCPTYMYRWVLLSTPWFKFYIHRFVADDWSLDLHDHPKRFISIGLSGCYAEHQPGNRVRLYQAPWIRSFPAAHIHRITLLDGDCWTLVIVGRSVREWGFWHEGPAPWFVGRRQATHWRWIHWRDYVRSKTADERKACS